MPTTALTGRDTIIINDTLITDLAAGTVAELTFPNELMTVQTGKDSNTIFAYNASGEQGDFKISVIRGSGNDAFLNNLQVQMQQDPPSFELLVAQLVKRVGDGSGNVTNDTYNLIAGAFTKKVAVMENTTGDAAQAIAVYEMKFALTPRSIT